MSSDSKEPDRKARAARLRSQIAALARDEPSPKPKPGEESPRDFVHRRMNELNDEQD